MKIVQYGFLFLLIQIPFVLYSYRLKLKKVIFYHSLLFRFLINSYYYVHL